MEWQPIETAPKDGRDILIFKDNEIIIGWWDKSTRNWCYQNKYLSIDDPQNWMPLPEPPNVSRETQEWD